MARVAVGFKRGSGRCAKRVRVGIREATTAFLVTQTEVSFSL